MKEEKGNERKWKKSSKVCIFTSLYALAANSLQKAQCSLFIFFKMLHSHAFRKSLCSKSAYAHPTHIQGTTGLSNYALNLQMCTQCPYMIQLASNLASHAEHAMACYSNSSTSSSPLLVYQNSTKNRAKPINLLTLAFSR